MGIDLSPLDRPDPSASLGNDGSWIAINNAYQDFLQFHYPDFRYVGPMVLQSITPSADGLTWTGTVEGSDLRRRDTDNLGRPGVHRTEGVEGQLRRARRSVLRIHRCDPAEPDNRTRRSNRPDNAPDTVHAIPRAGDLVRPGVGVVNQKLAESHAVAMSSTSGGSSSSGEGGDDGGHAWMDQGNSAGSGPFVITVWVTDDHVTMVANSNFWGYSEAKARQSHLPARGNARGGVDPPPAGRRRRHL
jgi:hypothetical protein